MYTWTEWTEKKIGKNSKGNSESLKLPCPLCLVCMFLHSTHAQHHLLHRQTPSLVLRCLNNFIWLSIFCVQLLYCYIPEQRYWYILCFSSTQLGQTFCLVNFLTNRETWHKTSIKEMAIPHNIINMRIQQCTGCKNCYFSGFLVPGAMRMNERGAHRKLKRHIFSPGVEAASTLSKTCYVDYTRDPHHVWVCLHYSALTPPKHLSVVGCLCHHLCLCICPCEQWCVKHSIDWWN